MSMDSTTLKNLLLAMPLASSEGAAITSWVDAYAEFASTAMAGTIPILSTGIDAGKVKMSETLLGMNRDSAATTKIPASVSSFWEAVALGLSSSFAGATSITPPPHATTAQEFADAIAYNVNNDSTADDALTLIAEILYNGAVTGGTVTVGASVFNIL